MKKVGTDKEKVRDFIEDLKGFVGTAGIFNFSPADHNGLSMDAFEMLTVKNGRFVPLPADRKDPFAAWAATSSYSTCSRGHNGSVYAIVGIGFNIIYSSTGIINFAQGEFLMLGGMISVSLSHACPWPRRWPSR